MRANEFLVEYSPPALINKTVNTDGIQLSINADGANVNVYALADGRQLGYVVFDRDGNMLVADDLAIEERYKGQGIAKIMYDYVKSLGFTIRRSHYQTDAGAGFWDKHRGEDEIWENFADGKKPGRKGLSKRVGIPKKATLSQLEKIAKSSTGERRRMAQWQLNMRRGRAKKTK